MSCNQIGDDAPCANRTHNLMIKSQIRASDLTRTEGVHLGFQATNDAELVPPLHPNDARSIPPKSHGGMTYLPCVFCGKGTGYICRDCLALAAK